MAIDQGIAHGEVLGQSDQSIVHAGVAVGVIPAQHVAHAGGGLLEGLVHRQAILVHGVEDPAVDGLQTVPHIRQGPAHDDAHSVLDIGSLHLGDQRRVHDLLIGIPDLLGIVLGLFAHTFTIPPSLGIE